MNPSANFSQFDPDGVGLNNGNFMGLPYGLEEAKLVLVPVPWDLTVSYGEGTAGGPANILQASPQLDFFHPEIHEPWTLPLFMEVPSPALASLNRALRPKAAAYIEFLENGGDLSLSEEMQNILQEVNHACEYLQTYVYQHCTELFQEHKLIGIVGGDHSVPLGHMRMLAEQVGDFGILQIDAHLDLREAYEGFTYSHASIFFHALQLPQVEKLVQIGIRDSCQAEQNLVREQAPRIQVFEQHHLLQQRFQGKNWETQCQEIITQLPERVYISFDIDGLDPSLCPHTGTPVPGGLGFYETLYLIQLVVESGRKIIGFDLCEVAGEDHEWDANVGARILYQLSVWTARSQGWVSSTSQT